MGALDFVDHPLPEREGLGMWVVDAKYAHALRDPEKHDALEFLPQAPPVVALEIEWINVLVLLRRVFGVLHAPVGAVPEPPRMGVHVRMIGSALESNIEGNVDARLACLPDEAFEILQGAQLLQDVLVPALGGTDGPRAPDVVIARSEGIVGALAVDPAYWMDGRQVQHVEAQLGHVR